MSISKEDRSHPYIVAFGGGTGMHCLLTGLKEVTPNLTCVVTVTDDGGSSGLLRSDLDIPPPGDLRNCLLALSEAPPLLRQALEWRFPTGELNGHNLGNLLIAAATLIKGDLGEAVKELHEVLSVKGRVLPSTTKKVSLVAYHADGTTTAGEVRISKSRRPIHKLELKPNPGPASPEIIEAIERADFFVFGPGSLFTSIIPNLLIPGVVEAIRRSAKPVILVGNIMTQPAETEGFSLADHICAFERHSGEGFLHAVVACESDLPESVLQAYRKEGAEPVRIDRERIKNVRLIVGDLAEVDRVVRHHPHKLAETILKAASWVRT